MHKPPGEKFLQALSFQSVAGGGGSHRPRMGQTIEPAAPRAQIQRHAQRTFGGHTLAVSTRSSFRISMRLTTSRAGSCGAAMMRKTWFRRHACGPFDTLAPSEAGMRAPGCSAIVRTTSFGWLQKNRARQLDTEFEEEIHRRAGEALNPETLLLQRADTQLLEQAMNATARSFAGGTGATRTGRFVLQRDRGVSLAFRWARSCPPYFARVNGFGTQRAIW